MLAAIRGAFSEANRYPYNLEREVQAAIARAHGVPEDHVTVGCGSGEILRTAVLGYAGPDCPLIAGLPTFEAPAAQARAAGAALIEIPVDRSLALDLQPMADAASGAGLVFLCNPNNPTGTVHSASAIEDFISYVGRRSPQTRILIDEAYHEDVDSPSYRTAVPIARQNPRVIVSHSRKCSAWPGSAWVRHCAAGHAGPDPRLQVERRRQRARLRCGNERVDRQRARGDGACP